LKSILIDDYIDDIRRALETPFITSYQISVDKRSDTLGVIEGQCVFIDGSKLHFLEFVELSIPEPRLKYRYHYADIYNSCVFRYDNAPHHPEVSSFPFHKHIACKEVKESEAPHFQEVIKEIEEMLK
jgi:hypothetical protein